MKCSYQFAFDFSIFLYYSADRSAVEEMCEQEQTASANVLPRRALNVSSMFARQAATQNTSSSPAQAGCLGLVWQAGLATARNEAGRKAAEGRIRKYFRYKPLRRAYPRQQARQADRVPSNPLTHNVTCPAQTGSLGVVLRAGLTTAEQAASPSVVTSRTSFIGSSVSQQAGYVSATQASTHNVISTHWASAQRSRVFYASLFGTSGPAPSPFSIDLREPYEQQDQEKMEID